MADQYAIQDQNRFPALTGHSGTANDATVRRVVVTDEGAVKVDLGTAISVSVGTIAEVSQSFDIDVWNLNDIEEASTTVTYIGQEDKAGNWYLKKIDTSSNVAFGHATVTNNPTISSYGSAWAGRGTITYQDYSNAF